MSMRRVTIEHVIRSPEDEKELMNQLKNADLRLAMWDYAQWLRSAIKYNSESLTAEEVNGIDKAREAFYQHLRDNEVSIDD
jgi:hypothetical protein